MPQNQTKPNQSNTYILVLNCNTNRIILGQWNKKVTVSTEEEHFQYQKVVLGMTVI